MLPILNSRNGFKGKIFSSFESIEYAKDLLLDCWHIHNKQIQVLKSQGRKVDYIYTEEDLNDCISRFEPLEVGERIKINDNLEIELNYNSHTSGSCNGMFYVRKPSYRRFESILYTSDLGCEANFKVSNYLKPQKVPTKSSVVITEATYCDNTRPSMSAKMIKRERNNFVKLVKSGLKQGKTILIPVFAYQRSQNALTEIYKALSKEQWMIDGDYFVYEDGVLMDNLNNTFLRVLDGDDKDLFREVMSWNKLKRIKTKDETMETINNKKGKVVLASSGFMENGKVMAWLPYVLSDKNSMIITIGYCSQDNEGSMGWKVLNKDVETIKLALMDGRYVDVKKNCEIYQQKGWSSHITYNELLDLFTKFNCKKIIVHHMDDDFKEKFILEAKEHLRNNNKTTEIIAVREKCCEQFVL